MIRQFLPVAGRDVSIRFKPACDSGVKANQLLRDVFANLIDNAIKHSKGSLEINITTSASYAEGHKYCRVAIEDDGPGIPDTRKASLFDFSLAIRQKAVGKGLGLYLVKTLVEDFHGRILVEDRVPGDYTQGTRFVILLPMATGAG